jgi:hypothetical protein
MLRSIKQIYGDKLGASDGEIGHVKDFYFDDQRWAVRYIVADTGSWIPGRLVLISPHAVGVFPEDGKILPVNLTRDQIEKSPAIESHKPVSRQFEEEYYRYYGWPYYWNGDALWGASGFPLLGGSSIQFLEEPPVKSVPGDQRVDAHLRSAKDIVGYQIQINEEMVGHITDFLIDDRSWVIRHLVINTGNRFSGKKVLLLPEEVARISWKDSTVVANITREALLDGAEYDESLLKKG